MKVIVGLGEPRYQVCVDPTQHRFLGGGLPGRGVEDPRSERKMESPGGRREGEWGESHPAQAKYLYEPVRRIGSACLGVAEMRCGKSAGHL